jgi:hypothetical protein
MRTKVKISERNYMANFMGTHIDTEDLITNGPQFTNLGGNPSDILDRFNNIGSYAGIMPIKSTAIPKEWIISGMRGSVVHKVHTPWGMRGPVIDENTGEDHYLAEQFSASDVPVPDKLSVVGITDLNTVTD